MPSLLSSLAQAGRFRLGHRLGRALHDVSELLYPSSCVYCLDDLYHDTDGVASRAVSRSPKIPLCAACLERLVPSIENACRRCGAPLGRFVQTSRRRGCGHCRQHPFGFQKLIRLGTYRQELRRACLRIKRANGAPLAAALADLLVAREAADLDASRFDLVIPVPQHWFQRLRRPHNPAATVAITLSRRLKVPLATHILAKARDTRSQKRLTPAERRANLRDAFRVRRTAGLRDARVLLVDDILTTGATASEAARLLRHASARSVTVAVIARVLATLEAPAGTPPPANPANPADPADPADPANKTFA